MSERKLEAIVLSMLAVGMWVVIGGCAEESSRQQLRDAQEQSSLPGVPPDLADAVGALRRVTSDQPLTGSYWHASWRNTKTGERGVCVFGRDREAGEIGPFCYDAASIEDLRAVQAVPSRSGYDVLCVLPSEADLIKVETETGLRSVRVTNGVVAIRSATVPMHYSVRINGLFRPVDLSKM